jgi:7-cyano-7-deazaguanine reductase
MSRIVDDISKLTHLGSNTTEYKTTVCFSVLETFPNKFKKSIYEVVFTSNEITSLCPKTGQPDFGKISITYKPFEKCIESKSLKLYLFSYRNEKSFMETIVNNILKDLVQCCSPRYMKVSGEFNARGGVTTTVTASYNAKK